MLKTNSTKAKKNIMDYIRQDLDYITERAESDPEAIRYDLENDNHICAYIWDMFISEYGEQIKSYYRNNFYSAFRSWASGLALGGLFCYYYNRSAVNDLGDILEESETERNKYDESDAEEMLTRLIYGVIRERKTYVI